MVLVRAGIGKVNATLAASLLCGMFGCRGLLVGGVAGGLGSALATGDVVIGRRVVCHDYGARVGGQLVVYQPGRPPLPTVDRQYGYDLPGPLLGALRTGLADHRPRVTFGTIVSGDALIACDATRAALHRDFGAEAVEMEGAAVAQLAARFDVPAVIVRAISDQAGATHATEVREHLNAAAEAAARTARAVLPILAMALDRGRAIERPMPRVAP